VSSKTDSDQQISSQKHTSREFKNCWEKTLLSTMKSEMHNKTSDFLRDKCRSYKMNSKLYATKMTSTKSVLLITKFPSSESILKVRTESKF
jgi:hypothetical protein